MEQAAALDGTMGSNGSPVGAGREGGALWAEPRAGDGWGEAGSAGTPRPCTGESEKAAELARPRAASGRRGGRARRPGATLPLRHLWSLLLYMKFASTLLRD